jgi:hypothetical protein
LVISVINLFASALKPFGSRVDIELCFWGSPVIMASSSSSSRIIKGEDVVGGDVVSWSLEGPATTCEVTCGGVRWVGWLGEEGIRCGNGEFRNCDQQF